MMSETPDEVVEHRPGSLHLLRRRPARDLPTEVSACPSGSSCREVVPIVTQHRRLAVRCPTCGARVVAPVPEAARGTPFGPRLHAVATYLKTFQALSYERLQAALSDLFGLTSQPGRADEPAAARARALPSRSRGGRVDAAPRRGRRLGRDRRQDRGQQRLSLGVPLSARRWCIRPRRRGAPASSAR